ncbi:xaa-Arg dipeptidase-like [Saccoglossus kowalevskii]
MSTLERLKQTASDMIDKASVDLNNLSQAIWKNPELNFQEYNAHKVLTDFLERHGFNVERNYHLDTAFRATYGNEDGLNVCVICEYDALPEIGHACGHNLIAECGAGAGLGIKAAMEAAGKPVGKLTVLGTPAEEGGGGKIELIEAGAFKDIDIAMMAHPVNRVNMHYFPALARVTMTVDFIGKAAHAAYAPWEGINALDAAVLFYQNMSVMRQQLTPSWRTHGVISNGGAKPNIIPEKSQVLYNLRTPTLQELNVLKEKAAACAEGAAKSTGCKVECTFDTLYKDIISNKSLTKLFRANGENLGLKYPSEEEISKMSSASTDMGNVTYEVPGIHPMYGLATDSVNHSQGFTEATGAAEAQEPTLINANALAYTALDVLFGGQDVMNQIKQDFETDMKNMKMYE